MISNNQVVNSQVSVNKETKEAESPKNTHSTDTEPEADVYTIHHQASDIKITPNSSETNQLQEHSKWKLRNGFTRLIEKIPNYEYELPKKPRNNKNYLDENNFVPLDTLSTDNNRFSNYFDAFLYIAQHCLKYYGRFTRENCRRHLKTCYIIDFAHDEFIPIMTHLSSRKFNKYFQSAQKELKYM